MTLFDENNGPFASIVTYAATNGHLPIESLINMDPVFVRHNYGQLPISALLDGCSS